MGTLLLNAVTIPAAAAAKSLTFFYIAGGALAGWALLLALLGLSRAEFPAGDGQKRAVIGISAILVATAMTAAVVTASKHHSEAKAEVGKTIEPPTPEPPPPGQAPAAPAASTPAGSTPTAPPASSGPLKIAALPGQVAFDTKALQAKAGKVTIEFSNPGGIPHDVQIAQGTKELGGTKAINSGKATFEVDLKPGTYTFFCSVPGHRQSGMEGTLTVT
jgi:plastocyanin